MPSPRSVLIIKPGSLGDIVHALPCVGYVKKAWPKACIQWIVDSRWKPLLKEIDGIHRLVEFPRERFRGPGGWARSVRWFRSLRTLQPDFAIDLQGLMRSGLMARASGAKLIVGGSDAREGAGLLYHVHAKVDDTHHAVDRYRSILAAAGVDCSGAPEFPFRSGSLPECPLPPVFVLLHPYARGEGKSLTPAQAGAFAQALAPVPVVLVGRGEAPEGLPQNAINLLNRTDLPELVGLASRAAFVVSVDSGPAHIAAAVNSATLVIHTWSDPRVVGPYNEEAHIWQGGEIRRQELRQDAHPAPSRHFTDADLQEVARWVLLQPGVASAR